MKTFWIIAGVIVWILQNLIELVLIYLWARWFENHLEQSGKEREEDG